MSSPQIRCEELEVILCDYVDGTLSPEWKAAVEEHLTACPPCGELARDIQSTVQFIGRAADVGPPPELITRIVLETSGSRAQAGAPGGKSVRDFLRRLWEPILRPRFAMSMALTFLSFAMIGKLVGVDSRPVRQTDLNPVKIVQHLEDNAHRAWERTIKYYEGLRLVYEVQSRYKEWTEKQEEESKTSAKGAISSVAPSSSTQSSSPSGGSNPDSAAH